MDNLFLFFLFYTMMITVFGGMQLVVYRAYKKWYTFAFEDETVRSRCKQISYGVLIVGNFIFFSRFIINYTTLHESLLIQQLIIQPGGIYFACIFILFVFSAFFYLYQGLNKGYKLLSGYLKKIDKPAKSPRTTDPVSSDEAEFAKGMNRKAFLKTAGMAAFTAPLIITTGLSAATHRNYIITKKHLLYPGLPSGLEGLKLVHISDIHSGIYMNQNQITEIFEIVNSLNPNLIAITGDLVDIHESEIPAIRNTISLLKSDYGVFACPGNHDHYASIDGLLSALEDKPVSMLQNASETIRINGESVSMIGIDDAGEAGRNFDDLNRALTHTDPDSFRILLSHRPHMFDKAVSEDIHLTLAGHTHGGQIGFEFAGAGFYPIDFFHDYSRGHYQKGDMHHLYVNVGVGLVGAPIRLVRPEITELTFTSDPSRVRSETVNA